MQIVYEDNHIIIVNKKSGELVQKDITDDRCLIDSVKDYIKVKYNKPGNVFLGLPHRLDRPTSGLVIFAKTGKALSRLDKMFAQNAIDKTYLAITDAKLNKDEGELSDYLYKNEKENKSYITDKNHEGAKLARLSYKYISSSDKYHLYEIHLYTGRHHQIRVQLAKRNVHIRGDLKYGAKRSNKDGSISLHSYSVSFCHPVTGKHLSISAMPDTDDTLWNAFQIDLILPSSP